jgi:hypothetical protein
VYIPSSVGSVPVRSRSSKFLHHTHRRGGEQRTLGNRDETLHVRCPNADHWGMSVQWPWARTDWYSSLGAGTPPPAGRVERHQRRAAASTAAASLVAATYCAALLGTAYRSTSTTAAHVNLLLPTAPTCGLQRTWQSSTRDLWRGRGSLQGYQCSSREGSTARLAAGNSIDPQRPLCVDPSLTYRRAAHLALKLRAVRNCWLSNTGFPRTPSTGARSFIRTAVRSI